MKRACTLLVACALVLCCAALPVSAAEISTGSPSISRVSGRVSFSVSASEIVFLGDTFSVAAEDIIKYDCTYTPKSASVDFGYVDSNNVFHYLNCTSGSINKSFQVSKSGQYTLAVRNNSSSTVTVTGTVKY